MGASAYERSMERLIEVVQEISLIRSLSGLMAVVKRAARELTGADGATFVLREGDKCHYADEDAISPLWKGQRFPMAACISGWVMLNGRGAFIEDIAKDPRIPADAYRRTFVRSLAMVPVRMRDPLAAIGNYWAKQHATTPEEMKLLQALANAASVAMENLELYERLERSHRLFSTFMDNAPFGAVIRDANGVIVFANPRFGAIHGKPASQLIGESMVKVVDPGTRQMAERSVQADLEVLRTRTPTTQTYPMKDQTGTDRHYMVTKFPIEGPGSEPQIGLVAIDISERVAAEEAREVARVQLQQAYKMATLGEMAGGIAHEINNPLAIIIGKGRQLCELLESAAADREVAKEFAGAMLHTANRIVGIVNGLRTISRRSEHDPCVLASLGSIVDGTVALVAARFNFGGVKLSVGPLSPELKLECRPPEISQVLMNLLSNAFDAVSTLPAPWARLGVDVEGEWVVIHVTDSGTGIPADLRRRIMAPFFTTKGYGKGTGLGLSIAKAIAEAHGGTLTYDEAHPHTRFMLRLPLQQART